MAAALDQTQVEVDAIRPGDLGRSTPCADYDVRTLLAHLVAVLRKLATVGCGGDMTGIADPADDDTDEWAGVFRRSRAEMEDAWAPDDGLEKSCELPWGTMTGRDLIDPYAHEFTAHSWNLARVTGRDGDLDSALAEAAIHWYSRNVPAESRTEGGPFGPVVEVPADADVYTRLAGLLGRPARR